MRLLSSKKKRLRSRFFDEAKALLLNLGFFVDDVLTSDRIKLFDFKLFWLGALVLGGGVEVAGSGA
jgi:hypothetical protein